MSDEPATALAQITKADGALLMLGSRAYGPLRRVLLGTVATELGAHSPMPADRPPSPRQGGRRGRRAGQGGQCRVNVGRPCGPCAPACSSSTASSPTAEAFVLLPTLRCASPETAIVLPPARELCPRLGARNPGGSRELRAKARGRRTDAPRARRRPPGGARAHEPRDRRPTRAQRAHIETHRARIQARLQVSNPSGAGPMGARPRSARAVAQRSPRRAPVLSTVSSA